MERRWRPFGIVSARGSSRIRHAVWCLATTSIYSEPVDSLPSLKGFMTRWFGSPRVASRFVSARISSSIDSISTLVKKDGSLSLRRDSSRRVSEFARRLRDTTRKNDEEIDDVTMEAKLFRDISHRIPIRLLSDRRDLRETAICDSVARTFIYKTIKW